ncbi:MAG: MFS transporter [Anaerolineae bacterium]|nr:MFS transporter [Anaerolineae bacterium]
MALAIRLRRGVPNYIRHIRSTNRNVRLIFAAAMLSGTSSGIFIVVFNLYILSLGIEADVLGKILSAAPFAQALGSIPAAFLAEMIGFRKAFLAIYGIAGLAILAQVSSESVTLISAAAFVGGLVFSGDFVVRLPFLATNTEESNRTLVYTFSSLIFGLSMSIGSLVAGYAPNVMQLFSPDLTTAYRYTLYIAGGLTLLAVVPCLWIQDPTPLKKRKISLSPYLWNIDRFTLQGAITSLFVGLSLGTVTPFLNIYFVHHLGTSREFYGTIAALAVIPSTIGSALSPMIASRLGTVSAITLLRLLTIGTIAALTWVVHPVLGALAYWGRRSLFIMTQPLSFSFAMDKASRESTPAVSAWLNVTYWLGNALAAPITGSLIAQSNYVLPFCLSSVAILIAAILNQIYFGPLEARPGRKAKVGDGSEIEES